MIERTIFLIVHMQERKKMNQFSSIERILISNGRSRNAVFFSPMEMHKQVLRVCLWEHFSTEFCFNSDFILSRKWELKTSIVYCLMQR